MSNEIKNRQHAIGIFAPVPAAPFTTPIVSSVGVSAFTRNSTGNYTVTLTEQAPFHTTRTSASLGANVLGIIGAQLAPGGASVLVTAFDGTGVPFDPQFFDLAVDTVRDGQGAGPAPALPSPPAPPGHTTLVGFATIDSDRTILRSGGIVLGVDVVVAAGEYGLDVIPEAQGALDNDPNVAAFVIPFAGFDGREATSTWLTSTGPTMFPDRWVIRTYNSAGLLLDTRFSVAFFKGS